MRRPRGNMRTRCVSSILICFDQNEPASSSGKGVFGLCGSPMFEFLRKRGELNFRKDPFRYRFSFQDVSKTINITRKINSRIALGPTALGMILSSRHPKHKAYNLGTHVI
ncbi:hypothetical protein EPI10_024018 [Gossypium australe]|uniref:Uncharacterized protein n=1 Tax=Gossypium australe TaxID=47621 RepID=A0A5B6VX85_9ROSI|nr:hypothetical protein EPI10_024018 [Gossypium australe]